jgi:propanol-preferring alcohol dehydrogenase
VTRAAPVRRTSPPPPSVARASTTGDLALERGGTVAINAIHLDGIPAFPYEPLWWERSIRSVANFTRDDARAFLALAAEIPIRPAFEVFPLDQANVALQRLKVGEVAGAAVLAIPPGA